MKVKAWMTTMSLFDISRGHHSKKIAKHTNEALNKSRRRRISKACIVSTDGHEGVFRNLPITHSDQETNKTTQTNYNAREKHNLYGRSIQKSQI